MAGKKTEKNFDYYYDKLSPKLSDRKHFERLVGTYEDKNHIFYDDETFLIHLLTKVSQKLFGELAWLSAISSQPTTYDQMIAYEYLKEKGRLNDARELAEKLLTMSFKIEMAFMLKKDYKVDELIAVYNESINALFGTEAELGSMIKDILDGMYNKKNRKGKDVYIG